VQESEGRTQSRTERGRKRSSRRRRIVAILAAILATFAVVSGLVWLGSNRPSTVPSRGTAAATGALKAKAIPARVVSATVTPAVATSRIEVPDLRGMTIAQATTVLRAAGLGMRISVEGTATSTAEKVVHAQRPEAGTVAKSGTTIVIAVPVLAAKTSGKTSPKRANGHYVVVIDPGHQSRADNSLEPLGPGSTDKKPRITAGATGVTSGVPEYEIDLEIATNLQRRLRAAGIRVVMTRTTNDVDISNVERAQIANKAKADLFIRVHADSSTDPNAAGVSTLYPATNQWTKPIVTSSRKAAALVRQHTLSTTGAENGGSVARSDIAGFNWSEVPAILVQTGFQSNAVEDKLLSSARYQDRLAEGMADGVLAYLTGGR
jgi:N-acetylmuramoyl-L-alanine amidase